MYGDYMSAAGCRVVLATDSTAALEQSLILRPDVIMLSDRLRPLDGPRFCEQLKGDSRTASIPIILLAGSTGSVAPAATVQDSGCDVLLARRVPPETLFRTVRETVARSRALLARASQAAGRSRRLVAEAADRRTAREGSGTMPAGGGAPHARFDAGEFLDSSRLAERVVEYRRGQRVYSQGDACDSVLYLRKGLIKVSVTSDHGRDCVVALLGPGDFFGEECLAGQCGRSANSTALAPSRVLWLEKEELRHLLHEHHELSDRFIQHMLARNTRAEQDLVDQLFNSGEQRLARRLLLMAASDRHGGPVRSLPRISQSTLAEIVGTTRSRINVFMKKFERLGLIEYGDGIKVNVELLSTLLTD
jgi:CRP-like cAMP-binding protein